MEWKNIYRGMIMGASDVIPGVSGGTMAVLLGIYDRLIAAINGFLSKNWKQQLGFLVPLGMGVAIAILTLSHVINWLFKHYAGPTQFFFLGLILGILPYLFYKANARKTFKGNHILLLLIGMVLVGSMMFLNTGEQTIITNLTTSTYLLLFASGIIASSAMILPGISGSFLLLIFGVYRTITNAITEFKLDVLVVTGLGVLIGLVFMSKMVNYFFKRYTIATYAIIIGMVIGSIFVVFPGWPASINLGLLSIGAFAAGLTAAYVLGRVEYV
ncbi:DUF368 domain-containing protein [Virgibacillus dokdonensis]|uniref:DUF368 domain-containing protein n=1 Tax=Virgibacillus dokdonensis TaxID=302167 RepID=A0ABU7VHX7_9BACI|nr:DUF368 domain-containing protein [Virgibacillus dokdonensis]